MNKRIVKKIMQSKNSDENIINIDIWYKLIGFLNLNVEYEQLRRRVKLILPSTKQR